MYTISKIFEFSASHELRGLPEGHQCANNHGHNYKVTVHLRAEDLNEVGFVHDYGEFREFKAWLMATFDHKLINGQVHFNPTAENLAKFIFGNARAMLPGVYKVTVQETDKTSATYEL